MQTHALGRLQRMQGNAYVQRLVAVAREPRGTPGRLIGVAQSDMVDEVRARQDGGSPLPDNTRSQMEGYFGADLSGVRVHTGGEAATLSRELGANAFTVGRDVFFADGKYNPGNADGQATLAHELTHVGQQGGFGGPAQSVQRAGADDDDQVQTLRDTSTLALQRAGTDDDDQVQTLRDTTVQRAGADDEDQVQTMRDTAVQRAGADDEDQVQTLRDTTVQRAGPDDDDQVQALRDGTTVAVQRQNEQPKDEDEQLRRLAVQRASADDEEPQ
jgi:hypothetical protein